MSEQISFRQRVSTVDWKAITSIDIDEIITKSNIKELQSIVDELIFCNFTKNETKNNNINNITKFIFLLQLISEYLLICQEKQFVIIRKLTKDNNNQKSLLIKNKKVIHSLKEDIKIYQRQLTMLRQSLNKSNNLLIDHNYDGRVLTTPRLINDPSMNQYNNDKNNDKDNKDSNKNNVITEKIIESLLANEKELRGFMNNVLEDQRKTFSNEISIIMESVKANGMNNANSINNKTDLVEQLNVFKKQMEQVVKDAVDGVKAKEDIASFGDRSNSVGGGNKSNNISDILRTAALEEYEEELKEKERKLNERERLLMRREKELLKNASLNSIPDRGAMVTPFVDDRNVKQGRVVAIQLMKASLNNGKINTVYLIMFDFNN